jgi:polar amino acid transport system permease protein
MGDATQSFPKAVRRVLLLIALTAGLSLLYAIQYYLGGPIGPSVTSEINDLALNPTATLVATASQDGYVRLWEVPRAANARTQEDWVVRELSGHEGPVVSVDFDRGGLVMYSAGRDGTVRMWNVRRDELLAVLNVPGGGALIDAALAADGSTLAALDDAGVIHIWKVSRGEIDDGAQPAISIDTAGAAKNAVALSPDGGLVASDDGAEIQIWDATTGDAAQRLEGAWEDETEDDWLGHEKEVTVLAFSPDGTLLASGGADKIVAFWDLASGEVQWTGEGHFGAITSLAFDADGGNVLSGSADNKAKIWRIPGGKASATFVGHKGAVNGVAFGSSQEDIFTGGGDGSLRLWDRSTTSEVRIEWTARGLQPLWAKIFNAWMLLSGLVGFICLWGLWTGRRWSHLLALALYIIGPIIVLVPSLLDTLFYPFTLATRLQIAAPLLILAVWYVVLVTALRRGPVVAAYEAPRDATLSEQLMASQRTRQLRNGLYIGAVWVMLLALLFSVLRQFNLDLAFMGHFLRFIMAGSGYTVLVSALSIVLAVVLALLGALGRLSRNPVANGVSGFYISLIRGTPLLVQIYIWYLGLPRLNIILSPLVAGILALGVNYGAYMTEIFRAGIQAIGIGQHEAAQALGMSRVQTLRRIVLPQAFRIVIPPIGNEFIAMMKDSSLVSVMSVWELTFRANKLGRQYFRGLETFIIAAAFYWVLTVFFQFLQGKLETYMARGERR